MATIGAKSPLTLRSVPKVLEYEGSDRLKKSASPQSPQGSPLRFEVEETMDLVNVRRSPLLSALREAVTSVSGIEDFEILETIGAGFFAEVYKVKHIPSERVMVLKMNKRGSSLKSLREVELLKQLRHPNILHYIGTCVASGQLHSLTEYVNGGSLESLLQNQNLELSWSIRVKLSRDIALGMVYLHDNHIFHRDLNTRNCLLRVENGHYTAVVADFGLAAVVKRRLQTRVHDHKATPKKLLSCVGTPYWMAPEVLNSKPYDGKADVFSFGIVLCEIISRKSADPDDIPRSNDFGLDEEGFRAIIEGRSCPEEFLELACHCSKVLPVLRPDFHEILSKLDSACSSTEIIPTSHTPPGHLDQTTDTPPGHLDQTTDTPSGHLDQTTDTHPGHPDRTTDTPSGHPDRTTDTPPGHPDQTTDTPPGHLDQTTDTHPGHLDQTTDTHPGHLDQTTDTPPGHLDRTSTPTSRWFPTSGRSRAVLRGDSVETLV